MKLRSSPIRPFVAGAAALILALLLLAAAAVPRSAAAADDDHPRTNPDPTAAAIVAGHGGRRILESSGSGNIFDQRTSTKKSPKGNKRANNKKKQKKKKVTLAEDGEVYLVQDISIFNERWTIFTDESETESEAIHINQLWTSSVPGEPIRITAFWQDDDNKMHSLTFADDTLTIFSSENKIEVKVAGVPAVKLVTDGETGEVYATVQQKNPIEVKSIMLNGQTVTPQEFKTEFQVAGETNFCTNSFLSQLLYTEIISMYSNSTGQCREYWELCLLSMPFVENHATALGAFVEWTGCFESMMTISGDPKKQGNPHISRTASEQLSTGFWSSLTIDVDLRCAIYICSKKGAALKK